MSKNLEEKENSLFDKLPSELIAYTAVYLNLADLFAFRRVCRCAKDLNVSRALENILSKPLRLKTDDSLQFFAWRDLLSRLALDMRFRDVFADFNPEHKIAVLNLRPRSYEISPETYKEISVNLFKSLKPALEEKRKSAEKKFCLIM